jgi:hypothetical protein
MNKRQSAAIVRARRAVEALEKVGLTAIVGESGSFYAVPTNRLESDMSAFSMVQDFGDSFGGGKPLPGVL